MVIEKLGQRYTVGCGRGYGIDIPNLEFKLNLIIDKEKSTWYIKDTRTEEDKQNGVPEPVVPMDERELKEGDTFMYEGTILAVDHDKLVQVISETGPLAFDRIFHERIEPELEFSCFEDPDNSYTWTEVDELPGEVLEEYTPPYSWMRIWHEKFVTPDRNFRPVYTIKVDVRDEMLGFTRSLYMQEWKTYYSGDLFSEEEVEWYMKKIMAYFYCEA